MHPTASWYPASFYCQNDTLALISFISTPNRLPYLIWAKLTHHSWDDIYLSIIKVLSFKFPLFVTLSAIAVILAVFKGIQFLRNRKDPFWDEAIGNYTFKGVGIADDIQDGGFLYSIFAPLMVGYGLVEIYDKPDDQLPEVTDPSSQRNPRHHPDHCLPNPKTRRAFL